MPAIYNPGKNHQDLGKKNKTTEHLLPEPGDQGYVKCVQTYFKARSRAAASTDAQQAHETDLHLYLKSNEPGKPPGPGGAKTQTTKNKTKPNT